MTGKLRVRLQMSCRDWHSLHHENPSFRFDAESPGSRAWCFQPYAKVPPVIVNAAARYEHAPLWFRRMQYDEERARGQEFLEDLASPGEFTFDITAEQREAVMVLTTSEDCGGVQMYMQMRQGLKYRARFGGHRREHDFDFNDEDDWDAEGVSEERPVDPDGFSRCDERTREKWLPSGTALQREC